MGRSFADFILDEYRRLRQDFRLMEIFNSNMNKLHLRLWHLVIYSSNINSTYKLRAHISSYIKAKTMGGLIYGGGFSIRGKKKRFGTSRYLIC